MSDVDDKPRAKAEDKPLAEEPAARPSADEQSALLQAADASLQEEGDGAVVTELGATKYVQTAFFAAGICAAYFVSKVLNAAWNILAEWPVAARQVPMLLRYGEDERPTFTLIAGAVIGLVLTIRYYRKEGLRRWASEVASELSKVTWPKREQVTNGTIVVLAAGAFATVYVGLLDRLWSFVTMLVYGA
jgi:preprotein translocase subunit SecE